nr:hypothetical protein [Tanacetum cinerariifolium]
MVTREEVGADKSTELGSNDTDEMVNVLSSMEAANNLTSGVAAVSVSPVAAKEMEEEFARENQRESEQLARDSEIARLHEKFIPVWKQFEDFVPMSSKEEGERVKKKGLMLDQRSAKRMKTSKDVSEEDLKGMMQLVPLEEVYVEAVQRRFTLAMDLGEGNFKYSTGYKDKEKELWEELKRLFESDFEDQLWTHNQAFMHDPLEWKLYETCGVHHVVTKDQEMFMLVEKDYPLRKGLTTVMICNKLLVEQYSKMANDLILKNEHYALWEVIEFGDSYKAPLEKIGKGPASESSKKKKRMTAVISTEDMQKRRNDVKARTTLLLALPDEHQLRFSKYETAQELWEAILKTFSGTEATKKTKKNQLKQEYSNFKAEGLETLEQTFNRLSGKGEVHTASIQVSTVSTDVATASLSHDIVCAYIASKSNGSQIKYEDITQIDEDDIEEIDIKWNIALLSMRAKSFWKKTGLERDVEVRNNKIEYLENELEQVKKENEGLDNKLTCFEKALKDLYNLLGSQRSDKNKEGLRYSAVPPPAQVYSPPKKDLFWTGLPEFIDDTVTDYSRPTPSIDTLKCNSSDLQSNNFFVFEHGESSDSIMSKPMIKFVKAADCPGVIKTNKTKTARKSPVKYAEMYRNTIKSPKENIDDKGYWDSGCSWHMTGNISYLSEYEPYDEGYVSFGQGGGKITGKGIIKTGKHEFENVYFVKELKYNQFSVSQIFDNKNSILFTDSQCIVLGKDFKLQDDTNVLLRTPRQHNMYSIDLNNIVPHKNLTCLVTKASIGESMLWHRRLGHLSFKTMNKLVMNNLVRGLPSKCFENDHTCVACLKGKQHKASCKTKLVNSVSKPLHTLHMDLFGPTSVTSLNHKCYCLVVTDDFSRCDNVGEFKNKEMNEFCTKKGIRREFSNARTPQQNEVSERRNRTLIEAARTMLADAKHPVTFGVKAVNTACYVQNMVLVNKSQNKTLHELFNSKIPAIGFLRPFGCHVMILNTLDHLGKFDAKGDEGYFVRNIDCCNTDDPESSGISNPAATSKVPLAEQAKPATSLIVETEIPTVSSPVPTVCLDTSPGSSSDPRIISKGDFSQQETPSLGNALTLSNRIHKDHPKSQIIGPVDTPVQTRLKSNEMEEQSFIATIHHKTNPELLQFYLFSCFLSQEEPKKIFDALKDPRVRPISTKWVLKNKKDERGIMIRNKARLVAQGYTQEEGIDYKEVFTPVARIEAIRLFLAYALFMGFVVYQMDVKSAFLYGTIDEKVYVMQPLGFQDLEFPNRVYKVEKAMYALHQAPRARYGTLSKEFEALMHEKFQMSAMGELTFFLGLQVLQKKDGKDGPGKDVELHLYRSMIGSLMYLTASRPDIMFAVCAYARHQVTPKECHLYAVKRIFRYLKGHPKLGLWYPKDSPFDLVAYSNSDYGGATQDRKSTTGGCYPYILVHKSCPHISLSVLSVHEDGDSGNLCQMGYTGIQWVETTNQETKILATVDGKPRTIFKSSLRRHLKLNDEEGISSLPDIELFENLLLIGYNILSNQRFTFQKCQFSYQWKFLIHTIMQCLSPKSTGFNEFSSNIATAVVCLAINRVYNFSKMTLMVFTTLRVNNPSFSGWTVPLFASMLVTHGDGSATPTEPHYTPSPQEQHSSHHDPSSPSHPTVTAEPISQTPTETPTTTPTLRIYTRRAIRIDQSKALSPDRENITKTSALPHESSPRVTSLDADEGSMQHKLQELMDLCTSMQRQQIQMAAKIKDQDLEISGLKARVKFLEDNDRGSVEPTQEDAPIKGGIIETWEEVRADKSTELGSNDTDEKVNVLNSMEAANIFISGGAAVSVSPVAGISTVGVPAVNGLFPTASAIFTTASVVIPYTRRPRDILAKDKGKEKVVESEVPKKRKLQEQIDAQVAKEIEEEFARENQRESEQLARDMEIARLHAKEVLKMMIEGLDRSNEVIAKHLQEYEQAEAELTVGEKIELINELVKYQDHHAKILKYQAQQSKPLSKKKQREFYISVLRSNVGWKTRHFRGMALEEIKEKFIPTSEDVSEEDLKGMMQLVLLEEVYVEAVKVKHPIIDWEIHSKGQREYWKIIKLGGHTAVYQFFVDMLKRFDREDLHQLWTLVKETLSIQQATKDKEKELWVELKRLFEPDFKDQLRTHNRAFMHDPLEWKLYDTCGVHHVFTKDQEMFMLVEKDYPLRKGLATVMICNKLQVEQYSKMDNDLILKYLQNEHYGLWEVIEFGDSYKAPPEETGKGPASESSTKKKGRTAIVSHLEFMDVDIKQDDLNQKFLTSLTPEWLMYTIVWRNRDDLDTMSLDDVYNHLKVYEPEVQKKSESNSQNMALISSSNTSSGKGEVHTASVPTASIQVSTISIDIDEDDIEEMDIKWNMALLSMRAKRFWKKTGKKITIQGFDVAGFDKSKEELAPKALMDIDGIGWDWSYMANEEENHALVADDEVPTEFAFMAKSSSGSEKEIYDDSYCSKSCLSQVEARLVEFKEHKIKFYEKIRGLERDVEVKNNKIEYLENELEQVKKEKQGLDNKLTGFEKASKDLDNLLGSQRSDKNKEGLGYSAVPSLLLKSIHLLRKTCLGQHMTGNISYLSEYEPYDGGYVSFGQGGGNITEAVNTACYVQNRVLVNKSQNKTLYELFNSRIPAIGFLRPFGCHVMILNTLDHLGKFDAKGDEGYFVGYSMSTKAFRVFNKRTKKVEENLHVDFLENKLIEKGAGPNWLFDIDTLTNSMNYVPVVVARTSSTNISGIKDVASQAVKKDVSSLRYIAILNWFHDAHMETKNIDCCNTDDPESSGISNLAATSKVPSAEQAKPATSLTVETEIPTVSSPVPTVCLDTSSRSSSDPRIISKGDFSQQETPCLGNALTLSNRFEDIFGKEADLSNMETSIPVSPTLTVRIHKDHPKSQIIGPVNTPVQTRLKSKEMEEQSFIATIHHKINPELLQFCLFSCFLSQEEPKKIFDAFKDPSWVEAMQEELLQFKIQNVWILVDCPKGVRPIGTKWVLKNKKDERGIMIRNKARLVAQGYTQEEGIDYEKVFTHVARIEAIRLFLAYALFMGFVVYQMDVKSAFLYGTINEEVYVMQPPGFQDLEFLNRVYNVEKAMGTIDQTLFIKNHKGEFLLVQVYVDDIIFGSSNPQLCREFEAHMNEKFQMIAMGKLTFFLGLQVLQKKDDIFLSQDKYVGDILKKFGYSDVRPDIMFAVCACARHQVTHKECQFYVVKRIFRYLKGHPKLGLWYPKDSPFDLVAYSDSDYGGATKDRKSTTRGCQFLGRRLILWQCKKQTIVATSTTKAEYVAAASGCGQVILIQNQMLDYGYNFMNTKIYIDNNSAICIVKNPVYHSKTKQIKIRHRFIRDCYETKLISVNHIHTDENVAYLLTKPFDAGRFQYLVVSIGMLDP